jgi:hypothetical protein
MTDPVSRQGWDQSRPNAHQERNVNIPYIDDGADSVNNGALDIDTLADLAGSKCPADVPCPLCGPAKREPHKRKKPTLRIWLVDPDYASYVCARCGEEGYARRGKPDRPIDRAELARRKREAELHQADANATRRRKAAWLWSEARTASGTIAGSYLRSRGIHLTPPSLRFLPARGEHGPAMVAAFGVPTEPEPGRYHLSQVTAVHLTRLQRDGSGKAPDAEGRSKIMVGVTEDWPIPLVPPNDFGGLAVAEGIENALSMHQATGLGAWAAGAAVRLPKLARVIAELRYVESVTIAMDGDAAGRRYALALATELQRRRGSSLDVATIEFCEVAHEAA